MNFDFFILPKLHYTLTKELTKAYGKGFDKVTLYRYCRFYKAFPEIVASVRQQSGNLLTWTHYRVLVQVEDKVAREWYANEALREAWSVRTLQRNISSQYYYRLLQTQKKELVKDEMERLTTDYQKSCSSRVFRTCSKYRFH